MQTTGRQRTLSERLVPLHDADQQTPLLEAAQELMNLETYFLFFGASGG